MKNTLPRERSRADLHRLPGYYELRNHLMDFLVQRSASFKDELAKGLEWDPRKPPLVEPLSDAAPAFAGAIEAETGRAS